MPDDGIRIIDIDGHVREADDLFEKYLEAPYRARAPKVEKVANGQLLFRLEGERHHRRPDESPFRIKDDGSPANENRHLATNPKQRLVAMDRDRIERGLLFPSAGLYLPSVQEEAYAAALCRAYNNWLYDYCGEDRHRLMGVGVIPVQDVKLAIDEAKRAVNELGFKGIFVRPNPVKGRNIDDAYYDPLYKTIVELGVPLLVHEGSGAFLPTAGADRFAGQWFFTHTISHPVEQMLASLGLICRGTLERNPELQVVFLEVRRRLAAVLALAHGRALRDPAVSSSVAENETERLFPPPVLHVLRSRRNSSGRSARIYRRRSGRLRFRLSALGRNISRRHRHDSQSQRSRRRDEKKNHGRKRCTAVAVGLTKQFLVPGFGFQVFESRN